MKTCMRHLQRRVRLQRHPLTRVHTLCFQTKIPNQGFLKYLCVSPQTERLTRILGRSLADLKSWTRRVEASDFGRCGKMESDALNDHHEFLAYEHWIHLLGSLTINTEYKEWDKWECGIRFNACGVILYRSSSCLDSRSFVAENDVWKSAQTKAKIVHN